MTHPPLLLQGGVKAYRRNTLAGCTRVCAHQAQFTHKCCVWIYGWRLFPCGRHHQRGDLIKTHCGSVHTCSPAPGWFHVWIRATNGLLGKSPQSNSSLQTLKFISIPNPHQLFLCNWGYISCLGVSAPAAPANIIEKSVVVAMIQETFINKDCTEISIAGVCGSIQSAK